MIKRRTFITLLGGRPVGWLLSKCRALDVFRAARYRPSCDRNTTIDDFLEARVPYCSTIVPIFLHKTRVDTGPGADAQILGKSNP